MELFSIDNHRLAHTVKNNFDIKYSLLKYIAPKIDDIPAAESCLVLDLVARLMGNHRQS